MPLVDDPEDLPGLLLQPGGLLLLLVLLLLFIDFIVVIVPECAPRDAERRPQRLLPLALDLRCHAEAVARMLLPLGCRVLDEVHQLIQDANFAFQLYTVDKGLVGDLLGNSELAVRVAKRLTAMEDSSIWTIPWDNRPWWRPCNGKLELIPGAANLEVVKP